jgi:glycerol-3-phosphate dehydrogenase
VRPLAAEAEEGTPPSSVSREDRLYRDPSGLLSAVGGKLTTYRATGEKIVDQVVRRLPAERRRALGRSRTLELPLRADDFDRSELETELRLRFGVGPVQAAHLVRTYGVEAEALLREAPPTQRRAIGRSRYTLAEVPWCIATECAATLSDVLERRVRAAVFADGQGLPQLAAIAEAAAGRAGWDADRTRAETLAYVAAVRRGYQIVAPARKRSAA